MPKIILASQSPQRKKLLQTTGVAFTTRPSGVEELERITSSCAALVKENALRKARDIAGKSRTGIVIGSDTVVYLGGKKIVLKPKDLAEAKRHLKQLTARPQWVYSGLALVDAATGREMADYEKTKVYMQKLSEAEIDRYHAKVPPMDKAGGFDIEGLGSLFIHRIEGCYTNVIGLPMAKLRVMLKKWGVSLLSVFFLFGAGGCTSEYNLAKGEQRTYFYSTEREVNMGSKIAQAVIKQSTMLEDVEQTRRVESILDRIVEVSDRKEILYFARIIDDTEEDDYPILNAFALPGGYLFVFKGLLDTVENDDQLAGIIAHEVAHVTARHSIERLQKYYASLALQIAAMEAGGGQGVGLAVNSLMTAYSRQDELEADTLAVKYLTKAGFDPNEMITFFEILKEKHKRDIRPFSYFRTHPHVPERIANIRRQITGKLEFRDYIKLLNTDQDSKW